MVVAGGWKHGWSIDYIASKIAEKIQAPYVVNLTNVLQIYDDTRNNLHDPISVKLCKKNNIRC